MVAMSFRKVFTITWYHIFHSKGTHSIKKCQEFILTSYLLVAGQWVHTTLVTNIIFYSMWWYMSTFVEANECIIHEKHSFLARSLENTIHVLRISSYDQISDRIIVEHDLSCYNSSWSIFFWEKNLRHNCFHRESELHSDLILLVRRKRLKYSIDRLNRIIGMERREYKVSSFCKCDCGFHGLKVTHFSDDDHIRIFTKNRLDSMTKALKMFSEFSLMNKRKLILVDELYRIFEGDDMSTHGAIDIIQHSRHGCRFTTSCWSSDEDDSFFSIGDFEEIFRKHDRLSAWNHRWNWSKWDTSSTNDVRDIDTKASSMIFEWEIESFFCNWSRDKHLTNIKNVIIGQFSEFFYRLHLTDRVAYIWIVCWCDMEIRDFIGDHFVHEGEKFLEFHDSRLVG